MKTIESKGTIGIAGTRFYLMDSDNKDCTNNIAMRKYQAKAKDLLDKLTSINLFSERGDNICKMLSMLYKTREDKDRHYLT